MKTIFLPAIAILLLLQVSIGVYAVGYDEDCVTTPTDNCDPNKGMLCTGNKCRCDADMIWNNETEACIGLLNGNCTAPRPGQPDNRYGLQCRQGSVHTAIVCDFGAGTSNTGKCKCRSNYFPEKGEVAEVNQCLPSWSGTPCHPSNATANLPCHPETRMECSNVPNREDMICHCPHPLNQLPYNMEGLYQRCLSRLEVKEGCGNDSSLCFPNAECRDKMCHCKKGYSVGNNGDCYLSHKEKCTISAECNQRAGLVCFEDACVCQLSPDQEFDEDLKQCVALEGSVCQMESYSISCKKGYECNRIAPDYHTDDSEEIGICRKSGAGKQVLSVFLIVNSIVLFFVNGKV